MIAGIDLGLRSIHVSLVEGDYIETHSLTVERGVTRAVELRDLARQLRLVLPICTVFVEEPVVAGSRNLRVALGIAQLAGVVMTETDTDCYLVSVSAWKKEVIGKGNATKEQVSDFLSESFPRYSQVCAGKQDLIDATCIALYGQAVIV